MMMKKNVSPGGSLAKVLESIGEVVILGIAKLLDGVIDLIEMVESSTALARHGTLTATKPPMKASSLDNNPWWLEPTPRKRFVFYYRT